MHDNDVAVAAAAARAIYDLQIHEAMPDLAEKIEAYIGSGSAGTTDAESGSHQDALVRRILNANFRLGTPEHAKALAAFAATPENSDALQLEALKCLGDWADPDPRDRILGMYRPLEDRSIAPVKDTMQHHLAQILTTASDEVRAEATKLASSLELKTEDAVFLETVGNADRSVQVRIQALRYLATQDHVKLMDAIQRALDSTSPELRAEARAVLAERAPEKGLKRLQQALHHGTTLERQKAFATLADLDLPAVDSLFKDWLQRLSDGEVDPAVQLDLLQAAEQRDSEEVQAKLKAYQASLSKEDPLSPYRVTLEGGNIAEGREVFRNHAAAQCIRCHQVQGAGGEAGPDLSDIGERRDRTYLLESLVRPNAKIAEGYEMVSLRLKSNELVVGTLQSENQDKLVVATPAGEVVTVNKANVQSRQVMSSSSMPPMAGILNKEEIRDVIAYLSSLEGEDGE